MAAGKVCTGFSKPYVAKYAASNSTVTYTAGQLLARGVNVTATPETSDDNNFYADNVVAESEAGTFTGGSINLTVDGLLVAAERLIMGLPAAGENGLTAYGDNMSIPDVGIGFIARYQSGGGVTYTPIIFPRTAFELIETSAATQEENIDWQTQDLTATIKRAEDANRNWKYVGGELETEAAAEAVIKTFLNIT